MPASRRVALAGIATIAPVASAGALLVAPAVATEADPFLLAHARFYECDAILDAHAARPAEEVEHVTEEEYRAPQRDRHEALFAAVVTQPATTEGWATKLVFLTQDPDGPEPLGLVEPLFAQDRSPSDEWRQAICDTLRAAAAMIREKV
jgi:hypothetical protein